MKKLFLILETDSAPTHMHEQISDVLALGGWRGLTFLSLSYRIRCAHVPPSPAKDSNAALHSCSPPIRSRAQPTPYHHYPTRTPARVTVSRVPLMVLPSSEHASPNCCRSCCPTSHCCCRECSCIGSSSRCFYSQCLWTASSGNSEW
jgi:hypothetical protein